MRCVPPLHEGSKILLNLITRLYVITTGNVVEYMLYGQAVYANLRIIGYTQSHRDMNTHHMHKQFSSPDSSLMTKN